MAVPIAAVILLLQLTAYANAIEAHLDILPNGDMLSKPIGSSILLTCKPKVDQPNLIGDMQWLDIQNRTIEPLNSHTGQQKPPMYTEKYPDGSLALFFNSLDESQAGNYSCIGTYANSVMLKKTVTIETIIAITWENAPLDQHPILGEEFAIQCRVKASPAPSVDWLYNGELIRTNDRYVIGTHALTIKKVQESDDGTYTCRASVQTTGELKERPIKVEVYTRPTIKEIPTPVKVVESSTANIACKASGKPPPMISWIKTLTHTNLSNADRFRVKPYEGILTFLDVKREDEGEYQCIATSPSGTATANIQVDVIIKPKIMEFQNITVVQNEQVDIMCKAFGRPPPSISFRKLTMEKPYAMGSQPNDDRITMINKQNEVDSETVANLTIINALTSDDGLYECIAQNRGGVAYMNGHLTVEYPPSFRAMQNNTIWTWGNNDANLTCIVESIPNATIRWQLYGDQPIERHPNIRQVGIGPVSSLIVTAIDSRYYTNYKCIASNRHGTSEYIMELREARRPGNLLDVKMAEISATTITFNLVPPAHQDLPIQTITVQYKDTNSIWTHARNKTWSVGTRYVIEDLQPLTSYDFRFAAMNEVGLGNWGNQFHQITPGKTVPMQPKILIPLPHEEYDISPYNNQYELAWVTPADNGEPIDMYRIKYCMTKRVSGGWDVLDNTCRTEDTKIQNRYWLKHLHSDEYYTVKLQAHNVMGFSEPGFARFKTNRGTDPDVTQRQHPLISSATIIGIVVAILLVIIIIIDVICCCAHKTGIMHYLCERFRRKPVNEETGKLGREEKEPLKEEKKITPIIDSGLRRESSITFDGHRSISQTGFVGKDSAV